MFLPLERVEMAGLEKKAIFMGETSVQDPAGGVVAVDEKGQGYVIQGTHTSQPSSATAQADQIKREDPVNEITDISTFHSTDKFDLERKNIQHYYVALSQYYKMRTQKNNYGRALGPGGPMGFGTLASSDQVDDHDLTITYIENGKLKRNFEKSKKEKEDNGELYEEILLFHGTDEENIDNIFNNNFDINHHPVRRSKV